MSVIKHQININNSPVFFFAPEGDSTIPGTLAGLQKGTWHFDNLDFNDGDVCLDIGCNVGIISLVLAKCFPNIKIYSFDANPNAISLLNMAIEENSLTNIYSYNLAVGPEDKKNVKFITYSPTETCLIQEDLATNERNCRYDVEMASIDRVFDGILLSKNVKFAKIDIETGEFDLFDHLFENREDILDKIEYLHLEIHPFDQTVPKSKRLKDMVDKKFGNKVFYY